MRQQVILLLVALLVGAVGGSVRPTITIGFIGTTFVTNEQSQFVRTEIGAQHLAAFMMAVDEINLSGELKVIIRPEVSLGNTDYIAAIQDEAYNGASAARDIFLSEALPQAVIIADTGAKALSAGVTLQTLGVPSVYTTERSSGLSHSDIYQESMRMCPSEAFDGVIFRRLCRHMGWGRVGVFYSEDDFGVDALFTFTHRELDKDTDDPIIVLAEASAPKHHKSLKGEVDTLKASGATIIVAFVSHAKIAAKFIVEGYRDGLFHTGTQLLLVCQEPNQHVIDAVKALLIAGESLDDVLRGYVSVGYYPEHHLHTPRGLDFVTKFRGLTATRRIDSSGQSLCNLQNEARTIENNNYPLYKVKGYPVCTGIASFTTAVVDPSILLTYDATFALGKALHYLLTEYPTSNSSAGLNNLIYELLVANDTGIRINGASGPLKWYAGDETANYFGQGDRTTGHSFKILNYVPSDVLASGVDVADGLALVGYFNGTKDIAPSTIILSKGKVPPQLDRISLCGELDSSGLIDGLKCLPPRYRTLDGVSAPLDMNEDVDVFIYPIEYRTIFAVVGALSLVAALGCLCTLYLFRSHRLVKYTQPTVLALVFSGYVILSVKILASDAQLSPGTCVADHWLSQIGFMASVAPLVVKLWRLDKIVNGKSLKRVKITDADALRVCVGAIAVLMVLLIIDSGVAHNDDVDGFLRDQRSLDRNQYTYTHFCGLSPHPASLAFSGIVYGYQCLMLLVAIVYLWKTRALPANINECGTIAPMVFAVTCLVVMTATLVGVVNFHPHVTELIVNLACGAGILLSINYYWIPKMILIYHDHQKQKTVALAEIEKEVKVTKGWGAIKTNITALASGAAPLVLEDKDKRRGGVLLNRLVQQDMPLPNGKLQESVLAEIADLKGTNLKAAFCQKQIGFLQGIIVALSQISDSSNNGSSSNKSSSNLPDSRTSSYIETQELTTLESAKRDKPQSSSIPAPPEGDP